MSNGSATPPNNNVTNGDHIQIATSTHVGDTKFIFPSGTNSIPISPGLFGAPFFNQSGNNIPVTPTLLTQAVSFAEPYKTGQIYSPFTLAPPTGLTGGLPRTPTLPPPSPHAIASTSFPLTAITNQGLPTSAATLVGSPFTKAGSFLDDITKIGSISPFIVSPSLSPSRKPNGSTTIFFPTTITANGEAKVTINGSADRLTNTPDGSIQSTDSPLMKREGTPQTCYIGGGREDN